MRQHASVYISAFIYILSSTGGSAQASPVGPAEFNSNEGSVQHIEPRVTWNTANSYRKSASSVDSVYQRSLPVELATLRFPDVYARSYTPGATNENNLPPWMQPIDDMLVVACNMFAAPTYWLLAVCGSASLLMAGAHLSHPARVGAASAHAAACIFCHSPRIRRAGVGEGMIADTRRVLGQKAFRCEACSRKFYRRWDYGSSAKKSKRGFLKVGATVPFHEIERERRSVSRVPAS